MHCIEIKVILACVAYGGPQMSRQNQKPHGKTISLTAKPKTSRQNQKRHVKTKNLTAKPKTSRQKQQPHAKTKNLTPKPNTSQQKQNSLVLPWVFAFVVRYLVFAVKYLVLP